MTLISPETEKLTKWAWSAVGHWTPNSPDANVNSFQQFWTGYRELGTYWVNKLILVKLKCRKEI